MSDRIELCTEVAIEVMGWNQKGNLWYRYVTPTGYKVATKMEDYGFKSFFRPDDNFFQLGLAKFAVTSSTGSVYQSKFPGKRIRCIFNDGLTETFVEDSVELDANCEIAARACLHFVRTWDSVNEGPIQETKFDSRKKIMEARKGR